MPRSPCVTPPMRQPWPLRKFSVASSLRPICSQKRSETMATSMNGISSIVLERSPPPSSDVRMPCSLHNLA